MKCVTAGDLRKALNGVEDDRIVVLRIYDERSPDELEYSSDIDSASFSIDLQNGRQTAEGDKDIVRLHVTLDLDD